jgi:hypothetical protein
MPSLAEKKSSQPLKLLLIGDTGSGKTGALASLLLAGYEMFILDFDEGTDVLQSALKGKLDTVKCHIETLQDSYTQIGTGLGVLSPKAFPQAIKFLGTSGWIDSVSKENFGKVSTWDKKRILVIDSLTFMGKAALNYVTANNNRAGQQPWQSDWGTAMSMLEKSLAILYSSDVKCNVVILSHVKYQENEEGAVTKGFPTALGKNLPPEVGRYFNMMLYAKTKGVGDNTKRVIYTKPEGVVGAKCPILNAPRELPAETGLAEIFKLWEQT